MASLRSRSDIEDFIGIETLKACITELAPEI
jgi:hypothetical protein